MKFAVYTLLVLCLVAATLAAPGKKEKSACSRDCGDKYEPVCSKAKSSGSKERLITFGSECVMGNYNCQHPDDTFEVKSKGECGGNVSVRLS